MGFWSKVTSALSDAEKNARADAKQAKTRAQKLADDVANKEKDAQKKLQDLSKAATAEAKKLAQKAHDDAQKALDHAKTLAKNAGKDLQNANKKVKKRLHDLGGKIRKAYKKLLRKATLAGVYASIRANANGLATRLYPAIATDSVNKSNKIKASFISTSKAAYSQVLNKWNALGGKTEKLNEAIKQGSSLHFLKPSSSLYPKDTTQHVQQTGTSNGKVIPSHNKGLFGHGFDGEVTKYALPFPNNSGMSNFIQVPVSANYKVEIFSGIDSSTNDSTLTAADNITTGTDATVTPDEQKALDDYSITDAQPEEKHSHWKAFIAWVRSLFHKKGTTTDESPYDTGSAADSAFKTQLTTDNATASELTADDMANLAGIADPEDNGDSRLDIKDDGSIPPPADDTIWGMNKYLVYGGGAVLAISASWGIYKLIQHFKKGKKA